MSTQVKLTRRRVLGILITIGLASAAMGVGTFALFSDQETSANNQISAGTLNLASTATANLPANEIVPGDSVPKEGPAWINTTYASASSVDPITVELNTKLIANDSKQPDPHGGNVTATAFGDQLTIDSAELYVNGTREEDLKENRSLSTAADLHNLTLSNAFGDVSPGTQLSLRLKFTFNEGAGNAYQAEGVDIEVTFNGTQQMN